MNVYEGIMQGLNEALEHAQGKKKLRTTVIHIEPVKTFECGEIRKLRVNLGMTQSMFAGVMGVSIKTVEAWECGRNKPDGAARRLLSLIESDPQIPEKYSIVIR